MTTDNVIDTYYGTNSITAYSGPTDLSAKDVTITVTGTKATLSATGTSSNNLSNLSQASTASTSAAYVNTSQSLPQNSSFLLSRTIGSTSLSDSFWGRSYNNTSTSTASGTGNKTLSGEVLRIYGGTPTANMPTTGTAQYAGSYSGIDYMKTVPKMSVLGTANMDANFGSGTVSGRIDKMTMMPFNLDGTTASSGTTYLTPYDITFSGAITGTQYSGSASLVNPGTTTTYSPTGQTKPYNASGTVNGGFFGSAAGETTGALALNKTNTATGNTGMILGSFGMKKQ